MNEQEQRIAIEQVCSQPGKWWCPACRLWIDGAYVTFDEKHDDPHCHSDVGTPDHLSDLNATHEMEASLPIKEWSSYQHWLEKVCLSEAKDLNHSCWELLHAGASQRAEAFLRMKGLWKDGGEVKP